MDTAKTEVFFLDDVAVLGFSLSFPIEELTELVRDFSFIEVLDCAATSKSAQSNESTFDLSVCALLLLPSLLISEEPGLGPPPELILRLDDFPVDDAVDAEEPCCIDLGVPAEDVERDGDMEAKKSSSGTVALLEEENEPNFMPDDELEEDEDDALSGFFPKPGLFF